MTMLHILVILSFATPLLFFLAIDNVDNLFGLGCSIVTLIFYVIIRRYYNVEIVRKYDL